MCEARKVKQGSLLRCASTPITSLPHPYTRCEGVGVVGREWGLHGECGGGACCFVQTPSTSHPQTRCGGLLGFGAAFPTFICSLPPHTLVPYVQNILRPGRHWHPASTNLPVCIPLFPFPTPLPPHIFHFTMLSHSPHTLVPYVQGIKRVEAALHQAMRHRGNRTYDYLGDGQWGVQHPEQVGEGYGHVCSNWCISL